MPIVVPTIIIKKPQPYPKIIPANHIEGPEGTRITGKRAKDATRTTANTGRPKALASHCMIGKRTYNKQTKYILCQHWRNAERKHGTDTNSMKKNGTVDNFIKTDHKLHFT
jgi:hypothetical protein